MQNLNNRALARLIAETVHTSGGYLYAGACLTGSVAGLEQEHWTCTGDNFIPAKRDLANNKRVLSKAPIGSEVGVFTSAQAMHAQETWEKVGPCTWTKVEDWEERWGDWGKASFDNLTGREEVEMYD